MALIRVHGMALIRVHAHGIETLVVVLYFHMHSLPTSSVQNLILVSAVSSMASEGPSRSQTPGMAPDEDSLISSPTSDSNDKSELLRMLEEASCSSSSSTDGGSEGEEEEEEEIGEGDWEREGQG